MEAHENLVDIYTHLDATFWVKCEKCKMPCHIKDAGEESCVCSKYFILPKEYTQRNTAEN